MNLSNENKKMLIGIARHEILKTLLVERKGKNFKEKISGELETKCGAFVSLYVAGNLRGCIGTFSEEETLIRNVKRMALAAAKHDSRFTPVNADETAQMKIEISVLSPRESICGPEEIEIGKHGIFIEQGMNRGTLLPQVAVKQGWTAEEFLGNCAKYKTGLGWDGWKTADLFTYEAIVFDSDTVN